MNPWILGAIIGLVGGITSGLLGVGGGVIMVPAFIYFLHKDAKVAVATSLAVIIPSAIVGVWKHSQQQLIDWPLVLGVFATAIIGAYLGATLNHHLSSNTVQKIFGVMLILVGVKMALFK
jgi:uncharacterized membrane protein YfcA